MRWAAAVEASQARTRGGWLTSRCRLDPQQAGAADLPPHPCSAVARCLAADEPDYEVDDDPQQAQRLDVSRVPLCITVSQVPCCAVPCRAQLCCAATVLLPAKPNSRCPCSWFCYCCSASTVQLLLELLLAGSRIQASGKISQPPLTLPQIGAHSVVDLTTQEELCSSASVQVAVDGSGAVCGLTKRRQKGVDPSVALVRPAKGLVRLLAGLCCCPSVSHCHAWWWQQARLSEAAAAATFVELRLQH